MNKISQFYIRTPFKIKYFSSISRVTFSSNTKCLQTNCSVAIIRSRKYFDFRLFARTIDLISTRFHVWPALIARGNIHRADFLPSPVAFPHFIGNSMHSWNEFFICVEASLSRSQGAFTSGENQPFDKYSRWIVSCWSRPCSNVFSWFEALPNFFVDSLKPFHESLIKIKTGDDWDWIKISGDLKDRTFKGW